MTPLPRHITLRNGVEISTPLLIPSLSSRATGPIRSARPSDGEIELKTCSIIHSKFVNDGIDEALLISAYDIHHDFLEDSSAFRYGFGDSNYVKPRLLFIDSGGYEKHGSSPDKQFGENQNESLKWEESDYRCTIDNLDDDARPVVVNWDCSGSYTEQIAAGQDFFGSRSHLASAMLLKPPNSLGVHDFGEFTDEDLASLGAFDIIGVTEKEIGETVLDRLESIAWLRRHLNDSGVEAPIHIFGGLDPLYTPLYFAAGGELFDGLGWLRYTYRDGVAMHRDAAAILDEEITVERKPYLMKVCLQNLGELRRLSDDLCRFARDNHDWTHFSRGDVLKAIFKRLQEQRGV